MMAPSDSSVWIGISETALPLAEAVEWATEPNCGAVVSFSGTVRDFSEGRSGVTSLDYEAYRSGARLKLQEIAETVQSKWDQVRRVAIWHRVGTLAVGDTAVIVVVATSHRDQAFDAARFCIEAVKESVPIWKREKWEAGREWGSDAHELSDLDTLRERIEIARLL